MAFLVVLEWAFQPAGRVALILHDVFGYPFTDVAQITGRTPAACRQLASAARRRIRAAQPPPAPPARQASLGQGLPDTRVGSPGRQRPHGRCSTRRTPR